MGVALENARLFDETKRLLDRDRPARRRAGGHQRASGRRPRRAARLRRRSSSWSATRSRQIFDAQVVDIALYDRRRDDDPLPVRPSSEASPVRPTDRPTLSPGSPRTRHPHGRSRSASGRIEDQEAPASSRSAGPTPSRGSACRSSSASEVVGVISPPEPRQTHAFSEADVRLLEHARLEPGRRPRERPPLRRDAAAPDRDRRARRRAGDHQRRPAGPGRRARHAGDVRPRRRQDPGDLRRPGRRHRRSSTARPSVVHFPYTIERGVRFPDEPIAAHRGPRAHVARDPPAAPDQRATPRARGRELGSGVRGHPGRAGQVGRVRAARSRGDEVAA